MNTPAHRDAWRILFTIVFVISICTLLGSSAPPATRNNPSLAPTGLVELISPGYANGLTLAASKLFINRSCGGELYASPTYATSRPLVGSSGTNLYANYSACSSTGAYAGHLTSINIAADDTYSYWLTRNRIVARQRHNPSPWTSPQTLLLMNSVPTADPSAYSIAVNNTNLYWNEARQFYWVPKDGSGVMHTMNTSTVLPRKLYATDGADPHLLFIDGNQLRSMDVTYPYDLYTIAEGVSDYSIYNGRIYFGENLGFAYNLRSVSLSDYHDFRNHYSSPVDISLRVASVAAAGSHLFWFERQGMTGGQIFSMVLDYASRSAQTEWLPNVDNMVADESNHVYWIDRSAGLYRLTLGMTVPSITDDMRITYLGVTQGIQVNGNLIPLVGEKPTIVRVYVTSIPGSRGPWRDVRARLDVEGGGVSHYAMLDELPAISHETELNETFNFMLSGAETVEGSRHITATIFTTSGRREDNRANNTYSMNLTFSPRRELRLPVVLYSNINKGSTCSSDADDGYVTPWNNVISHTIDARDVLPIHLMSVYPAPGLPTPAIDDATCTAYLQAVDGMKAWIDRAYPSGGQTVLIMQPDSGHPGGTCWGTSNGNSVINIQDFYKNHTLAHEMGHSFPGVYSGRHTWDADSHYPRTGEPGDLFRWNWMGDFIGLQTYTTTRVIIGSVDPAIPTHNVYDLMSYGPSRWSSPYTYCKLLKYVSGGSICCPDSVEGGCSSPDVPSYAPDRLADAQSKAPETQKPGMHVDTENPEVNDPYLYVSGWISSTDQVTLNPFEIVYSSKDISTPGSGSAYDIKLLDNAANTLYNHTFDLVPTHLDNFDDPGPTPLPSLFSAYLPWDSNTVTITVEYKSNILAQRLVSAHAPLNVVQSFAPTEPVTGTHTLSWIASDADSDPLVFSIWYSPDNGNTWLPIEVMNTNSDGQFDVNFNLLPGSNDDEGLLRVLASDGVRTTELRTETTFTVAHKPPIISLFPSYAADGNIALIQANAIDPEDGAITDPTRFSWSSDWDGPLGDGAVFNPTRLSPGEHILTATVFDYDDMQASATIKVSVPGNPEAGGLMAQPGLLGSLFFDASLPMTLTVPSGALKDPVRFRASLPLDTSFDPPGAIGPSFVITAALSTGWPMQFFNTPLTLTISYDDDEIPTYNEARAQIFTWDEDNLIWTGLATQVDPLHNLVTASLLHLSRYVLVIPDEHCMYLPSVHKGDINLK